MACYVMHISLLSSVSACWNRTTEAILIFFGGRPFAEPFIGLERGASILFSPQGPLLLPSLTTNSIKGDFPIIINVFKRMIQK